MNVRPVLAVLSFLILGIGMSYAQSNFCYDGATVKARDGRTALFANVNDLGDSKVIRFSVRPLVTRYTYLVTDETNTILKVSSSSSIEIADLGVGSFRIWAFSHVGSVLAQPGQNAAEAELATFCYELTDNFVLLDIFDGDPFKVQILHHNDGESSLLVADEDVPDVGGVHRFKQIIDELKFDAFEGGFPSVLFSAGDNFLPGPAFTAGLRRGPDLPLYDVEAQKTFGYDAIAIGNHEFDFGPDILEKYIRDFGTENAPPFVSANLDFTGEPGLQELVDNNRIRKSTRVFRNGNVLGVIGLTTPELPRISSPRRTQVMDNLVEIVAEEVADLKEKGVNKIILISHLQGINNDIELVSQIRDIDIAIAGGGDEFLSNDPEADAIPGVQEPEAFGPYPMEIEDANGQTVLLVGGPGAYTYLGNLTVTFTPNGNIMDVDEVSGPVPVITDKPDEELQASVIEPVTAFVAQLDQNVIGTTEVNLDGVRANVRTQETNAGNLIADALLWQANLLAPAFGIEAADVAIQNGGGIRRSVTIPAGDDITELNTFDMLPFANFVTVMDDLPAARFKEVLERAVSAVENVQGQFAQVAGFSFVYDPQGTAQVLDDDANVITPGERIVSVTLDDGTVLVENGAVVESAPSVRIATIDFLARGGDTYPYRGLSFTTLGVTYQQALANYIVGALAGNVSAAQYPEGGEGRIQTVVPPALQWNNTAANNTVTPSFDLTVTPNPFLDKLTVDYTLEKDGEIAIFVTDVNGKRVADLYTDYQYTGRHQLVVDATQYQMTSGVYYVTLKAGAEVQTLTVVNR